MFAGATRELLQSSRVARLKLESQGCRNPGLELANAFSVLPGTNDVMAASGVFTQPLPLVGFMRRRFTRCRQDLKHPPTAPWVVFDFFMQASRSNFPAVLVNLVNSV